MRRLSRYLAAIAFSLATIASLIGPGAEPAHATFIVGGGTPVTPERQYPLLPDLTITNASCLPSIAHPHFYDLRFNVKNAGNASAGPAHVSIVAGSYTAERNTVSLPAGYWEYFTALIPEAYRSGGVEVDDNHAILESNEANNWVRFGCL